MNEKELGRALLQWEADVNSRAMADAVMRRDRRRVITMAVACVAAWMLVVALAWGTILPMLAKVVETQLQAEATAKLTAAEQRQHLLATLSAIKGGTVATCLGTVISTLLAAVCTVRLITFSRTSTLRQVNARLDEISSQIKILASSLPKQP